MVQHCCIVNCHNRCSKGTTVSFHRRSRQGWDSLPSEPLSKKGRKKKKEAEPRLSVFPKCLPRFKQWLKVINRQSPDGKPWQPKRYDKVCSDHFLLSDFNSGFGYKILLSTAVPSIFPAYHNKHGQIKKKDPVPKKRTVGAASVSITDAGDNLKQKRVKTEPQLDSPLVEVDISEPPFSSPSVAVDISEPLLDSPLVEVDISEPPFSSPLVEVDISEPPFSNPLVEVDISEPPISSPLVKVDISEPPISSPLVKVDISEPPISSPLVKVDISEPSISSPLVKVDISEPPFSSPSVGVDISEPPISSPSVGVDIWKEIKNLSDMKDKQSYKSKTLKDLSTKSKGHYCDISNLMETHAKTEPHLSWLTIKVDLSRENKLSDMKEKQSNESKKLKNLKTKSRGRDCDISSLLDRAYNLRLLQEEEVNLLKENFGEETFRVIENEIISAEKSKCDHQFSDQLKAFAVTLHYYSSAAYEFLRKYLHLPHLDLVCRWACSNNDEPGFLRGVMDFLTYKLKLDRDMKDVAIMFDAMCLRKELIYDQKAQVYGGHVNHGFLQIAAADTLASEALVFLVVGLKRSFKYPIAYFLVDKISPLQQAHIVRQSISALTGCGFEVHSVVSNGAYILTASHLGCQINNEQIDPTFEHPDDSSKSVHYLFDAAHLINSVRRCLVDNKILKLKTGEVIKWQYIVELHQLQSQHALYPGNYLNGKHKKFNHNKMNVCLAAQTLSASVADAIEYCREDLGLTEFAGSEDTCVFLRLFGAVFDLCNSSNCLGKGYKSPLTKANFERKSEFVRNACDYITRLTDKDGKPLVKGRRKTGFVGFIVTMRSVLAVGQRLLLSNNNSFFLTYKLSLDHLETLFSKIRRTWGDINNEPNALQFKLALRDLLQKNGVRESHRGSCCIQPEVNNTLFTESSSDDATPLPAESSPFPQLSTSEQSPQAHLTRLLHNPGVYHDHVLHYITGFICRNLRDKVRCSDCFTFLATSYKMPGDPTFTNRRNHDGLIHINNDFLQVVKTADRCLRRLLLTASEGPLSAVSSLITRLVTLEVINSLGAKVFADLNKHCRENHRMAEEDDHVSQMIKEVCTVFCKIVLPQHGRLCTARHIIRQQGSLRRKLTKAMLFLHV